MRYLSRRVDFSAMHSYQVAEWSDEKNQEVFGLCSNPHGHGHDYQLEVMVKGNVNSRSGIVVNTVDIKHIVGTIVEKELDGKFINKENSYFHKKIPTTENIVTYLWETISPELRDCELHRLRLHENPFLFATKEEGNMVSLTRKYHFCAAHRLHSNQLSNEENVEIFGKCNNPYGHGHNYYLEVTLSGLPDPVTGMIANLSTLDEIVEKHVLEKLDHKHLNLDVQEFKDLNPTSEVLVTVIFDLLSPHLPNLQKTGLWETEKNYFEYEKTGVSI